MNRDTTTPDPASTLPNVLATFRRGTDALIVQLVTTSDGFGRLDVRKWIHMGGRWQPSPAGVRLRYAELGELQHAIRSAEGPLADLEARRAGLTEDDS